MEIELIVLLTMLGVFLAGNFLLKLPVSLSMVLGAVGGALVAGQGFPLRHLFEGTFVYVDTFLIIASAMVFMTVIEASGALEALNAAIVHRFHKVPALMLVLLMLMVMFPGMVTGSSTAAVLSSGALVAPVFLMLGIPKAKVGAILALGAIMGMAAPPVNIPAMLIAGGVDMPYIGFEGPLLLLTIPGAIGVVLALGYKYARKMDRDTVLASLNTDIGKQYGVKIYLPLALLVVLLVLTRALPGTVPNL
ncbi:MAG TPA: TRAP transporter large permease, partial [Clostridiales bacterium]|nr:TRAP transporter large permease [Clostridiales bacterium]